MALQQSFGYEENLTVSLPVQESITVTANGNSADQPGGFKGGFIFVDLTAITGTTPTIEFSVEVRDPVTGKYVALQGATTGAVSSITPRYLQIYPGIAETANQEVSSALNAVWRVKWVGAGGVFTNATFTIGAVLVK